MQFELAGRVVGPVINTLNAYRAGRRLKRKKAGESPFGPPLESVRKLRDLMTLHHFQGRYADGAVPVAWVTSGFPSEILRPLGFHVLYPENHAALCATRHMVPELSDAAEKEGFLRDICGYARTDFGSIILEKTPVGRLPRPDMLACCTNICQTVLYWYRALAERFKVPLVLVDTPFVYGEVKDHHIDYVNRQLGELIEAAEKISGRKLDMEVLERIVRLAYEGSVLWGECLATGKARPSPWTGFDTFFHIAPIVTIRGTEECNAYYRMLRDELRYRIQRGIGGIRNEKYRLIWDNLPIWFNIREMSTMLAESGFNFVCATYSNAWAEAGMMIDPGDPMGSAARAYTNVYLNRDLDYRLKAMKELAREYGVDGAVLHSDRSCKPYSVGQIDVKKRLSEESGIRVMVLEADHADPRQYAAEQGRTRLQAFMESFHE